MTVLRRAYRWIRNGFDLVFGLAVILVCLAAMSAIPVLHFISLGYLLEASARIARSGRWRDGLIGLRAAAWLGKVIAASWVIFLPIRVLHSYWTDSQIISPGGSRSVGMGWWLAVTIALAVCVIAWSICRGGRVRDFLWFAPLRFLRRLGQPVELDMRAFFLKVCIWVRRVASLFVLGFFGFLGAAMWLLVPAVVLYCAAQIAQPGVSLLVALVGGVALGFVVLHLPTLQTRYAISRDFAEFRRVGESRRMFRQAPGALWLALLVTVLFALPLYVLKIEVAPSDLAWLPNLVFVAFMLPARLVLGWAISRASRRETEGHWAPAWLGRVASLPIVLIYALVVWLTQYLSWHGSYSLLEQHAFMLPAPMLGL